MSNSEKNLNVSFQSSLCVHKADTRHPARKPLSMIHHTVLMASYLPSATKLRRLCFYTCLSFCSRGGLPQCMLGYHPPRPGTPPPDQAPPGPGPPREQRLLLLRTVRILLECILVSIIRTWVKVSFCQLIIFIMFFKSDKVRKKNT